MHFCVSSISEKVFHICHKPGEKGGRNEAPTSCLSSQRMWNRSIHLQDEEKCWEYNIFLPGPTQMVEAQTHISSVWGRARACDLQGFEPQACKRGTSALKTGPKKAARLNAFTVSNLFLPSAHICAMEGNPGPASFTKGDASECSGRIQDAVFDVLKPLPDVGHLLWSYERK